jgi:hypothetical protein
MEKRTLIAESFDRRTLTNMEVALERACRVLSARGEEHRSRVEIAKRILECARRGDASLVKLTMAGMTAANRLESTGQAACPPKTGASSPVRGRDRRPPGRSSAW